MSHRPRQTRRAAAATLVAALLVSGAASCSGSDGGPDGGASAPSAAVEGASTDEVLAGLAEDVIVPSYQQLMASLSGLEQAVAALCNDPSTEALEGARTAWREAIDAWQGTRAAGVGPALDERLMSDVGFAARPRVIQLLLEGEEPVDVPALEQEGAAAKGLYAIEEALFGDGSDELASTSAAGTRRCTYAIAVATLATEAAAPVANAWTGGDAVEQFESGLDGGPRSSIDAVVDELAHRLEEIDAMVLRDLAAAEGLDDLDESRRGGAADHRLADRAALLAGISAAIGDGTTGISALVAADDADLAARLVAAQRAADDAMAALPASVTDAFEDPDAVAEAAEAVAALKVLLSTEVASQLGVTITFSDSDGDS